MMDSEYQEKEFLLVRRYSEKEFKIEISQNREFFSRIKRIFEKIFKKNFYKNSVEIAIGDYYYILREKDNQKIPTELEEKVKKEFEDKFLTYLLFKGKLLKKSRYLIKRNTPYQECSPLPKKMENIMFPNLRDDSGYINLVLN